VDGMQLAFLFTLCIQHEVLAKVFSSVFLALPSKKINVSHYPSILASVTTELIEKMENPTVKQLLANLGSRRTTNISSSSLWLDTEPYASVQPMYNNKVLTGHMIVLREETEQRLPIFILQFGKTCLKKDTIVRDVVYWLRLLRTLSRTAIDAPCWSTNVVTKQSYVPKPIGPCLDTDQQCIVLQSEKKIVLHDTVGSFLTQWKWNLNWIKNTLHILHHSVLLVKHLHHELHPLTFIDGGIESLWITNDYHVQLIDVSLLIEQSVPTEFLHKHKDWLQISGLFHRPLAAIESIFYPLNLFHKACVEKRNEQWMMQENLRTLFLHAVAFLDCCVFNPDETLTELCPGLLKYCRFVQWPKVSVSVNGFEEWLKSCKAACGLVTIKQIREVLFSESLVVSLDHVKTFFKLLGNPNTEQFIANCYQFLDIPGFIGFSNQSYEAEDVYGITLSFDSSGQLFLGYRGKKKKGTYPDPLESMTDLAEQRTSVLKEVTRLVPFTLSKEDLSRARIWQAGFKDLISLQFMKDKSWKKKSKMTQVFLPIISAMLELEEQGKSRPIKHLVSIWSTSDMATQLITELQTSYERLLTLEITRVLLFLEVPVGNYLFNFRVHPLDLKCPHTRSEDVIGYLINKLAQEENSLTSRVLSILEMLMRTG